jgi:hypothetical protein
MQLSSLNGFKKKRVHHMKSVCQTQKISRCYIPINDNNKPINKLTRIVRAMCALFKF